MSSLVLSDQEKVSEETMRFGKDDDQSTVDV